MQELEPGSSLELDTIDDIPPAWLQLAVLVLDGSGSMTLPLTTGSAAEGGAPSRTKADAVDEATRGLLERLKRSTVAPNLEFAYISFNDDVTEQRPREMLARVGLDRSYDPTAKGIGRTAIHRGLAAAAGVVEGFMRDAAQGELGASAIVVLMSDGEETDNLAMTTAAAARLRAIDGVDLAACMFATHGQPVHGEQLLQSIVSRPDFYQRVYDAEQLRRFFHASITARGNGQ